MFLTMITGHGDKVHLQINKLVSMSLASKIVLMIAEFDEATNAE